MVGALERAEDQHAELRARNALQGQDRLMFEIMSQRLCNFTTKDAREQFRNQLFFKANKFHASDIDAACEQLVLKGLLMQFSSGQGVQGEKPKPSGSGVEEVNDEDVGDQENQEAKVEITQEGELAEQPQPQLADAVAEPQGQMVAAGPVAQRNDRKPKAPDQASGKRGRKSAGWKKRTLNEVQGNEEAEKERKRLRLRVEVFA